MCNLSKDEINAVSGGKFVSALLEKAPAVLGVLGKTTFVTSKKLSMVWCIGKEAKAGIQNLNAWSVLNAGMCIFVTTLARETAMTCMGGKSKKE